MDDTPEAIQETDKTNEVFLKLAGQDGEVDWQELKEILDYALRNALELPSNQSNINGLQSTPGGGHADQQTAQTTQESSVLLQIIGLICGAACKDTPLADLVPPPAEASQTMNHYNDLRERGFSNDICRSMVAMLDKDRSGRLGYQEFKELWMDLKHWKNVFGTHDHDNSGTLSGFELRQALNSAGYRLNNHILNILMHRYGNKKGELLFEDFILCAVKLKTMIDMFKERDENSSNQATFSLEEWIETTLYS